MSLPIKISPDPLVISTVELRFISDLGENDVLKTFFPVFGSLLPNLSQGPIPQDIKKKNEQFKFAADYILKNDEYSVSFSNNVISFQTVNKYTSWPVYFAFIKEQLKRAFEINVIKSITRIGVRYASILEHSEDISLVLKYLPSFSINGYTESLAFFRTDLKKNKFNLHLQIGKNSKAQRLDVSRFGTLVDIDATLTELLNVNEDIFRYIDDLHTEEKILFFDLLTPQYLAKLNPLY